MRGFKLVLAIVFVFLAVAWLPDMIIDVTNPLCDHKALSLGAWLFIALLAIIHSDMAIRSISGPVRGGIIKGGNDG